MLITYIHERADGKLVEYRRYPYDPTILHMQGRVLRQDGNPYDDQWYTISDVELLRLQRCSDIVEHLSIPF